MFLRQKHSARGNKICKIVGTEMFGKRGRAEACGDKTNISTTAFRSRAFGSRASSPAVFTLMLLFHRSTFPRHERYQRLISEHLIRPVRLCQSMAAFRARSVTTLRSESDLRASIQRRCSEAWFERLDAAIGKREPIVPVTFDDFIGC